MPRDGRFGALLREMRAAAGLSQEALAEQAALSVAAIASLEHGRRLHPRSSTVTALAAALKLSSDDHAALIQAARRPGHSPEHGDEPRLVGRDRDLSALVTALRATRPGGHVTVLGPGGVGKTVLVKAVVARVAGEYRHGTAFVDVSSLAEVSPVVTALAQAFRLPDAAGQSWAQLGRALSVSDALVVLDSSERVPRLGLYIADLCREAPGLTVVMTSRIPLGVEGEHRFPVPPLAVPTRGTPVALRDNPSVRLFIDRAQAAAPSFDLTDQNADAVAALCARLGGLPLALELAAARLRLLPVADLLNRLERGLAVLNSVPPRLPARHQSLRATLEWTYRLLDPAAQRLLAALGVFRGAFAVEAVERVCAPEESALDRLEELLDAGLLVRAPGSDARLTMLDTVTDFASDLLARQDSRDELRDRHLAYYLDLAERMGRGVGAGRQADALAALERDHDNLREALDWCAAKADGSGLRLALVLASFWRLHGHFGEGRRQLTRALASPGAPDELRGRARYALALLAFYQGDLVDAYRHARQSLAILRAGAAQSDIADALNVLGNIARERGEHATAVEHYQKSLAIFREFGDEHGIAAMLGNLGTTAYFQRDFTRAAALHTESLSIRAKLQDIPGLAKCLYGLSNVAREIGELDSAIEYGSQSLALREQLGDRHGRAVTLSALAATHRARGDPLRAAEHAARALSLGREVGDAWIIAAAMAVNIGALHDQSLWQQAAESAGALSNHLELSPVHLDPADTERLAADLAAVRAQLGEAAYTCAHTLGRCAGR